MKNMKYPVLVLATVFLMGCQGNSSEYVTHYLNKGFDGRPVSDFFYNYGYPAGRFVEANGDVVYEWTSIKQSSLPPKVNPGSCTPPSSEYQRVDTYEGKVEKQYCELRINTDSNEIIRSFNIAVDSTGKWSTSRCSEIFDRTYP